MPSSSFNEVLAQYTQATTAVDKLRKDCERRDEIINRDYHIDLPVTITAGEQPIELLSAIPEDSLFTHVAKLMTNPTFFDLNLISPKDEKAKRAARRILLWVSATWQRFNADRWWDEVTAEGQCKYGLAITRLTTNPWPGTEEAKDLSDREKAMRQLRFLPFEGSHASVFSSAWLEQKREPSVFMYKAEIPVMEAHQAFTRSKTEGKVLGVFGKGQKSVERPSVDKAGKLKWVGDAEPPDETVWTKKLTLIVRDAPDPEGKMCPLKGCEHVQRIITEYLCGPGSDDYKQAEQVNEYESPFPGSSFLITPGRRSGTQAKYELKYRPLMLTEIDYVGRLNYIDTTIATMAERGYGRVYANASKVPDHLQQWFTDLTEGGKKNSLNWPSQDTGTLGIFPELEAYPNAVDEHLAAMRETTERNVARYGPNPVTVGLDFPDANTDTATEYAIKGQSARVPYNQLLDHSDATIRQIYGHFFHAIRFLDRAATSPGEERKYYVACSGQENIASGSAEAGEVAYICKSDLESIEFELVTKTESETIMEEVQRWKLEVDKFNQGVTTPEQLIRAAGFRDTQGQMRELKKAELRAEFYPQLKQAAIAYLQRKLELDAGLNLGAFYQNPQQQMGAPPTNGAMPEQTPVAQLTGQHISPPLIEGPSGGSSPVGGV